MSKTEQNFHNLYWLTVVALWVISLYFFLWTILPATWFFQNININSVWWAVDLSFTTEFNWTWTGKVVNVMNCTSDLLIKEKKTIEVLPFIYKEIEALKPVLTWN